MMSITGFLYQVCKDFRFEGRQLPTISINGLAEALNTTPSVLRPYLDSLRDGREPDYGKRFGFTIGTGDIAFEPYDETTKSKRKAGRPRKAQTTEAAHA